MPQATEGHPAMLVYLNNVLSIGPTSVAGINRDRGLNENLAREILELHTLGVRTGYSQADVTNFAKVLTGWTIRETVSDPDHGGEFVFLRRAHEPEPESVIGHDYPDTGVGQGQAVLADLARHPATARHVATKLARLSLSKTLYAWRAGANRVMLNVPASMLGIPAVSLPLLSADGMPLGLQVAGFAGEDARVFAIAAAIRDLLAAAL